MTNENGNVTPSEDGAGEQAQLDFGEMIRNASPTLRRFVIYQGIILIVLLMVVVGTVAFRGSVKMLAPEEGALEDSAVAGEESGVTPAASERVSSGSDAVELAVRPEGAVLIQVERRRGKAGQVLILHFRRQGRDFIRIVDEESGVVTAYDIP